MNPKNHDSRTCPVASLSPCPHWNHHDQQNRNQCDHGPKNSSKCQPNHLGWTLSHGWRILRNRSGSVKMQDCTSSTHIEEAGNPSGLHTKAYLLPNSPTPPKHFGDAWIDELWMLADATVSEISTSFEEDFSILTPLFPLEPMPTIDNSPSLQREDPIAILSIARDLADSGKRIEAKRLRREAMLLIQALT